MSEQTDVERAQEAVAASTFKRQEATFGAWWDWERDSIGVDDGYDRVKVYPYHEPSGDGAFRLAAHGTAARLPAVLAALDGKAVTVEDVRKAVLDEFAHMVEEVGDVLDLGLREEFWFNLERRLTAKP